MSSSTVNPYAAPIDPGDAIEAVTGDQVVVRIDPAWLRHNLDHYMLRRHPLRLTLVSVGLILASGYVLFATVEMGLGVFLAASAISLSGSAAVYHASIVRHRRRTTRRLAEVGLVPGVMGILGMGRDDQGRGDADFLHLTTDRTLRWPTQTLIFYRTSRGTIVCPEPDVPIYVPRVSHESTRRTTTVFIRRLRQSAADPAQAETKTADESETG